MKVKIQTYRCSYYNICLPKNEETITYLYILNIENLDTPIVKLKFFKISEKVKTDSNISILSEINNFDTLPKYIYTRIHKSNRVRSNYPEHKLLTEIFLTTCHNRLHDGRFNRMANPWVRFPAIFRIANRTGHSCTVMNRHRDTEQNSLKGKRFVRADFLFPRYSRFCV